MTGGMFGSQAQELFEPINKDFTEHVTHKTWTNFAVEEFTAAWLAVNYGKPHMNAKGVWVPDPEGEKRILEFLEATGHPLLKLLQDARLTSGSINGRISEKFVEASRGTTPQSVGLTIQGQPGATAPEVPGAPAPGRVWGRR